MTAIQLKSKIDKVLESYPKAVYIMADMGIIYVFTDGVLKSAEAADVRICVGDGKVWLLEGVTI